MNKPCMEQNKMDIRKVMNHQPCWWFVVVPTGPLFTLLPKGGLTNHYLIIGCRL